MTVGIASKNRKYHITEDDLRSVIDEISHLNPKPGSSYAGGSTRIVEQVVPDFTIRIKDGELELTLNGRIFGGQYRQ